MIEFQYHVLQEDAYYFIKSNFEIAFLLLSFLIIHSISTFKCFKNSNILMSNIL